MLRKAMVIWIVGLITIVPYTTHYLFFRAAREQYALLITLVLFWIFGFWGVVGPLAALIKVRSVLRAIGEAKSSDDLARTMQSDEARDAAIEVIAAENHIPRFLAARVYGALVNRLSAGTGGRQAG